MLTTKNTVITHIIQIVPIQQHPLRLPQHSHTPPTCPLKEITPKHTGNYILFLQVPFESWTVINLEGPYIHIFTEQKLAFLPMTPSSILTYNEMTQAYSITQTQTHPESSLLHYTCTHRYFVSLFFLLQFTCGEIIQLFAEQKSHVHMQVHLHKHLYAHIWSHNYALTVRFSMPQHENNSCPSRCNPHLCGMCCTQGYGV